MVDNVWRWAMLGVSERLEFLTDVLYPYYGTPQTRKLRVTPRLVPRFTGTVFGAEARKMEMALRMGRAEKWNVPLTLDFTTLLENVGTGEFTIPVNMDGRRFYEGGDAMLMDCNGNYEIVPIEFIDSEFNEMDIGNSNGLENAWRAGSYIMPVVEGYLSSAPAIQKQRTDAFSYSVEFQAVDPSIESAAFNADTYRTYPVLPTDCVANVRTSHDRPIELLDTDTGLFDYYDIAEMPMTSQNFTFFLKTRAAIKTFRELIYAMAGRWQPLWVPSFCKDFIPVEVLSTTVINVEIVGLSEWDITANARDVQIKLANQTVYARIVAVTPVDDIESIEIDTALPGGTSADDIQRMSLMAFCTQSSDTNVMRLNKKDYVTSELQFTGINNAV